MTCPNKTSKEWKLLVETLGENEAYRIYLEGGEQLPSLEDVEAIVQRTLVAPQISTNFESTHIDIFDSFEEQDTVFNNLRYIFSLIKDKAIRLKANDANIRKSVANKLDSFVKGTKLKDSQIKLLTKVVTNLREEDSEIWKEFKYYLKREDNIEIFDDNAEDIDTVSRTFDASPVMENQKHTVKRDVVTLFNSTFWINESADEANIDETAELDTRVKALQDYINKNKKNDTVTGIAKTLSWRTFSNYMYALNSNALTINEMLDRLLVASNKFKSLRVIYEKLKMDKQLQASWFTSFAKTAPNRIIGLINNNVFSPVDESRSTKPEYKISDEWINVITTNLKYGKYHIIEDGTVRLLLNRDEINNISKYFKSFKINDIGNNINDIANKISEVYNKLFDINIEPITITYMYRNLTDTPAKNYDTFYKTYISTLEQLADYVEENIGQSQNVNQYTFNNKGDLLKLAETVKLFRLDNSDYSLTNINGDLQFGNMNLSYITELFERFKNTKTAKDWFIRRETLPQYFHSNWFNLIWNRDKHDFNEVHGVDAIELFTLDYNGGYKNLDNNAIQEFPDEDKATRLVMAIQHYINQTIKKKRALDLATYSLFNADSGHTYHVNSFKSSLLTSQNLMLVRYLNEVLAGYDNTFTKTTNEVLSTSKLYRMADIYLQLKNILFQEIDLILHNESILYRTEKEIINDIEHVRYIPKSYEELLDEGFEPQLYEHFQKHEEDNERYIGYPILWINKKTKKAVHEITDDNYKDLIPTGKVFDFHHLEYTDKDGNTHRLKDLKFDIVDADGGLIYDQQSLFDENGRLNKWIFTNMFEDNRELTSGELLTTDDYLIRDSVNKVLEDFIDKFIIEKSVKILKEALPIQDTINEFGVEDSRYKMQVIDYMLNTYISNVEFRALDLDRRESQYKTEIDWNKRGNERSRPGIQGILDEEFYELVIADISLPSPIKNEIDEYFKEFPMQGSDKIASKYKSMDEVFNAQTIITVDFAKKIAQHFGNEKQYAETFARLEAGQPLPEDIAKLQSIKTYYYDNDLRRGNNTPQQVKDSKYTIFEHEWKGSDLELLSKFLRVNLDGKPIFSITPQSAAKTYGKAVTYILIRDENGKMRLNPEIRSLFDGDTVNLDRYRESEFVKRMHKNKLKRNFRSLRLQQDVADHIVDEHNKLGVQIAKMIWNNLQLDEYYQLRDKPILGRDMFNHFQELVSTNIRESFKQLIGELGGTIDVNGEPKITDRKKFFTRIYEFARDNGMSANALAGLKIEEKNGVANPKLPIYANIIHKKIESILFAQFTNRVIAQKHPGGHVALVANVLNNKRRDLLKTQDEVNLSGVQFTNKFIDEAEERGDYRLRAEYWDKENKKIKYAEVIIAGYSREFVISLPKRYDGETEEDYQKRAITFVNTQYQTDFKTYDEVLERVDTLMDINKIPEEVRTLLGYRIPTEDKHSCGVFKVVGFLKTGASQLIVPDEYTVRAGLDYDIDSEYLMQFNFHKDKNGKFVIDEFVNEKNNASNFERFISNLDEVRKLRREYRKTINRSWKIQTTKVSKLDEIKKGLYNELVENRAELERQLDEELENILIETQILDASISEAKRDLRYFDNKRTDLTDEDKQDRDELRLDIMTYMRQFEDYKRQYESLSKEFKRDISERAKLIKEAKSKELEQILKRSNTMLKYKAELDAKIDKIKSERQAEFESLTVYEQNSRKARENEITHIFKSILTDPKHYGELIQPNMFGEIRDAKDIVEQMRFAKGGDMDMNDPIHVIERTQLNMDIRGLKGNSVAYDGVVNILIAVNTKLRDDLSLDIKYNKDDIPLNYKNYDYTENKDGSITIHFKTLGKDKFGNWTNIQNGLVTNQTAQVTSNILDGVKFPMTRNLNKLTLSILKAFPLLGVSHNYKYKNKKGEEVTATDNGFLYVTAYLEQDIIYELVQEMLRRSKSPTYLKRDSYLVYSHTKTKWQTALYRKMIAYYSQIKAVVEKGGVVNFDNLSDSKRIGGLSKAKQIELYNKFNSGKYSSILDDFKKADTEGSIFIESEYIKVDNKFELNPKYELAYEFLGYKPANATVFSLQELLDLFKTKHGHIDYIKAQLELLEHFKKYDDIGKAVSDTIQMFNADKINIRSFDNIAKVLRKIDEYNNRDEKINGEDVKKDMGGRLIITVDGVTMPVSYALYPKYHLKQLENDINMEDKERTRWMDILRRTKSAYPILETYFESVLGARTLLQDEFILEVPQLRSLLNTLIEELELRTEHEQSRLRSYMMQYIINGNVPFFNINNEEKRRILGIANKINYDTELLKYTSIAEMDSKFEEFEQLSLANKIYLIQNTKSKYYRNLIDNNDHILHAIRVDMVNSKDNTGYESIELNVGIGNLDAMIESLNKMYHNDKFLKSIAQDLIRHSYLTNALTFGFATTGKVIPTPLLYNTDAYNYEHGINYAANIRKVKSNINNIVAGIDKAEFTNAFLRANPQLIDGVFVGGNKGLGEALESIDNRLIEKVANDVEREKLISILSRIRRFQLDNKNRVVGLSYGTPTERKLAKILLSGLNTKLPFVGQEFAISDSMVRIRRGISNTIIPLMKVNEFDNIARDILNHTSQDSNNKATSLVFTIDVFNKSFNRVSTGDVINLWNKGLFVNRGFTYKYDLKQKVWYKTGNINEQFEDSDITVENNRVILAELNKLRGENKTSNLYMPFVVENKEEVTNKDGSKSYKLTIIPTTLRLQLQENANSKKVEQIYRKMLHDNHIYLIPTSRTMPYESETSIVDKYNESITINDNLIPESVFNNLVKSDNPYPDLEREEVETEALNSESRFPKLNIFTVKPIRNADKKATIKASIATQFIGFGEGIIGSSTESYRQQAGKYANTGNYSSNDVIFVSIGGKRGTEQQQKEQQDRTIKEALKAIEAGATLITDNATYLESSDYNTGEKRLAKNLEAKGYIYSEVTIDGEVLGVWDKINSNSKINLIYSQLGSKTQSEHVVIKSWNELKDATTAILPNEVISTRIKNSNEHFGNPFSHEFSNNLIKVDTIKEAVLDYIEWIIYGAGAFANNRGELSDKYTKLTNFENQRSWIVKQLVSKKLKNKPILYYKELNEPSHATALDYLINKFEFSSINSNKIAEPNMTLLFPNENTIPNFIIQAHSIAGYRDRTIYNSKNSDLTLSFDADLSEPGYILGRNTGGDKFISTEIVFDAANNKLQYRIGDGKLTNKVDVAKELIAKIKALNKKDVTINIAGNTLDTLKKKFNTTQEHLNNKIIGEFIELIFKSEELKDINFTIRSGGQSGVDEAGAKAAIKLGLKTIVTVPKNLAVIDNGKNLIEEAGLQYFRNAYLTRSSKNDLDSKRC